MHVTDKAGKKDSRVNAAIIIFVIVPAVEADMDIGDAIMAVTVVITAGTCLGFPFL